MVSCSKLSLVKAKEIDGNLNIETFDVRVLSIYGEILECIEMEAQYMFKEDVNNIGKIKSNAYDKHKSWDCQVLSDDEEKAIHELCSEYEKFKSM